MPEYDDATMLAQAERAARFHYQGAEGRIEHVERTVALIPAGHGVLCQATAWLHHVGEDVPGMHPAITGAARALRPRPGEGKMDHYRRIADNAIAVCVFRAHLFENLRRVHEMRPQPGVGGALTRAVDSYLDADQWMTRHVLGYRPITTGYTPLAHVPTMPRPVLDKLDQLAEEAAAIVAGAPEATAAQAAAVRSAIEQALVVVSAQIREDLAGLADEQEPSNYAEDDYPAGYRHAMTDAAQLRSLS